MWEYNRDETPPAPFIDLVVQHIELPQQSASIQAKIDTGADISALPVSVITALDLPVISKLIVEGYDGNQSTVSTYGAALEIGNGRFRSQEFIGIHEPHALLGRDILNFFYVLMNGPDLNLQMQLKPFDLK